MNGTVCYNTACELSEMGFKIQKYDVFNESNEKFHRTYLVSKKYKYYHFFNKTVYFGHFKENEDNIHLTNLEGLLMSIKSELVRDLVIRDYMLIETKLKD